MTILQDLRYAVRTAGRDKGFTAVAILTLALGIGANTALFTIVHAVLLAPLPLHDPDRLVRVTADFTGQHVADAGLSIPELFDLRRSGIFSEIAAVWPVSANLTETDEPERVETALVDANYFTMLGVGPAVGRLFTAADATPGITEVAVISHALWMRRFGGDPAAIGKRIRIDNDMYSIIGVAPPSFRHPGRGTTTDVEVWAPAGWLASPFPTEPVRRTYPLRGGLARLPQGVSIQAAQDRLNRLAETLRRDYPSDYPAEAGWTWRAIPLHDDLVGNVRPALLTLLGAVGFVLLIACANVASLLLARSSVRQREVAIRRALGAGRTRLTQQLLTESVALAAAGGLAGLLVATWGIDLLVGLSPADLPNLYNVHVNGAVLLFSGALSIVTGIVFGLAPAIQTTNGDLNQVMRESSRSATPSNRIARLRGALVVGEFALALVLLVGAALLIQSFWRLQRVDLGFRPQSVLTFSLWLPQPNDPRTGPYFTHDARVQFYRGVFDRIAALPGVEAAGGVSVLPLSGARGRLSFSIEGRPAGIAPGDDTRVAESALATPDYFRTLGIDLVRGRLFDDRDIAGKPIAIVVSESFARRYFAGGDAIGSRIAPGARIQPATNAAGQPVPINWMTIVGIVRDVKTNGLDVDAAPAVYRSVWQVSNLSLAVVVRAESDPRLLAEQIRREVRAIDPNEPIFAVRTMETVIAAAMAQRRFTMLLLAVFAATALALSAIGIYGVMAYFVSQRTHEFGVRMALGATPRDVLRLVLAQGIRLAAAGVVAGVIGAAVLVRVTRTISAQLYGVDARDPLTFIGLSAVLTMVALAACYVPARRAIRVSPIAALRYE
jgi:putative ABC transport system permease protein